MAILYNKSAPPDNITYLIQDKGKKQKSQKEMEALRDERNRQSRVLGLKTLTKLVPEGEEINQLDLDANDAIAIVGYDKQKQEELVTKIFPNRSSSIVSWGKTRGNELGKARPLQNYGSVKGDPKTTEFDTPYSNIPGGFGIVSSGVAEGSVKNVVRDYGVNLDPLQYEALGSIHEVGHTFIPRSTRQGHMSEGVMLSGSEMMDPLQKGETTLEALLNPAKNKGYISYMNKNRAAYRTPVDNLAKNRARRETIAREYDAEFPNAAPDVRESNILYRVVQARRKRALDTEAVRDQNTIIRNKLITKKEREDMIRGRNALISSNMPPTSQPMFKLLSD